MTLNGEMALILRYFTEFGSFRGVLRKSGWQSHNCGQFTITMSSSIVSRGNNYRSTCLTLDCHAAEGTAAASNKSPMPLTDPLDAVPRVHRAVHRCDIDSQYDKLVTDDGDQFTTDRPPKLTASETISRSRDVVGAHQNLNGSRDLTMCFSAIVCHPWASTCYLQPTYQIWSLSHHSLWRYKRCYKMSKWGGLG